MQSEMKQWLGGEKIERKTREEQIFSRFLRRHGKCLSMSESLERVNFGPKSHSICGQPWHASVEASRDWLWRTIDPESMITV